MDFYKADANEKLMTALWKKESQTAHDKLANIRGDFHKLRKRYVAKEDEVADKEIEVLTLRQSVRDLRDQLKKEMSATDYWFRKSATQESEHEVEKRASVKLANQQHEFDAAQTEMQKQRAVELGQKVIDLEFENEALRAANAKLNHLVERLIARAARSQHYLCDTQSSLAKKVKRSARRVSEEKSEKLDHLLRDIESDVRVQNLTNYVRGSEILKKTKSARRQKELFDACCL